MASDAEFQEEKKLLSTVVALFLNRAVGARKRLKRTFRDSVDEADPDHRLARQQSLTYKQRQYSQHADEPYFGRVIYKEDTSSNSEDFYIGYFFAELEDGVKILNWRSLFATAVWDASNSFMVQYRDSEGDYKRGELFLKRRLTIHKQQLMRIDDLVNRSSNRRRSSSSVASRQNTEEISETENLLPSGPVDPDAYLQMVLQGKLGRRLETIVGTVQRAQQDLIRESPRQILIIQGSAGSGKTSIALHRISVLTFQENQLTYPVRENRVLVIGTSPVFLNFVSSSNLLRHLHITRIQRHTFVSWAREITRLSFSFKDRTFHRLVDLSIDRDIRADLYRRSRLKGDLKMRDVLDQLVEYLVEQVHRGPFTSQPTGFGNLNETYHVTTTQVRDFFAQARHMPYNQRRIRVMNLIIKAAQAQYEQHIQQRLQTLQTMSGSTGINYQPLIAPYTSNQPDIRARAIRQVREEIARDIKTQCQQVHPGFGAIALYRSLLTDQQLLQTVAQNILSQDQIDLLHDPSRVLNVEDIGAITYLHLVLNGQPDQYIYDHVVVDEAQDISPLQFWLMRQFNPSGSMTILGDMAQSIHSYRGLHNWRELRAVFSSDQINYQELTKSYRSTHEIISFGNIILSGPALQGKYPLANPFPRHGDPVHMQRLKDNKQIQHAVAMQLKAYGRIYDNIAIVVRSVNEAHAIERYLRSDGIDLKQILSPDHRYDGGQIIILAELTKGIEFQACIVANASDSIYTDTEFDGRLLYVVVTRALHALTIFWTGSRTVHLEDATGSPDG